MLVFMNAKVLNKLTLDESLLLDVMRRLKSVNLKTTLESLSASSSFNVNKTRKLLISMQTKDVVVQGLEGKRTYSIAPSLIDSDCPLKDEGES
ncbi:hypothetical protein KS4_23900 [Poriferisphaera corsica]|uniref:Uncharacterized protein n=1 Tax=Poriferisphaera corsica TaxID=2528020 RepID=A0A517YVU6_9BACT|nr:hypothetical protein [Poriferisphaera corsica]QDU34322.1 hypothetical protein KS4_23900 [Poriferisphaera corsica]